MKPYFIFSKDAVKCPIQDSRYWWGSYLSAKMQSVYSTASADWAVALKMNLQFRKQEKVACVVSMRNGVVEQLFNGISNFLGYSMLKPFL